MVGRANLAVVLRSKWVRRLSMAVATLLEPQETVFCLHKKSQGFLFRQNIRQMGVCEATKWMPVNFSVVTIKLSAAAPIGILFKLSLSIA